MSAPSPLAVATNGGDDLSNAQQQALELRLEAELNSLVALYGKGGSAAVAAELVRRYPTRDHFYKIGRKFYRLKTVRALCRLIGMDIENAKLANRHMILIELYKHVEAHAGLSTALPLSINAAAPSSTQVTSSTDAVAAIIAATSSMSLGGRKSPRLQSTVASASSSSPLPPQTPAATRAQSSAMTPKTSPIVQLLFGTPSTAPPPAISAPSGDATAQVSVPAPRLVGVETNPGPCDNCQREPCSCEEEERKQSQGDASPVTQPAGVPSAAVDQNPPTQPAHVQSVHLPSPLQPPPPAPVGIALSGGGIRSAFFQAGVLKYLALNADKWKADHPHATAAETGSSDGPMLGRLRWLSSVSGGGYASAGWLSHIVAVHKMVSAAVAPFATAVAEEKAEAAGPVIDLQLRVDTIKQFLSTISSSERPRTPNSPEMVDQPSPSYFTSEGQSHLAGLVVVALCTMVCHVSCVAWVLSEMLRCITVAAHMCEALGTAVSPDSSASGPAPVTFCVPPATADEPVWEPWPHFRWWLLSSGAGALLHYLLSTVVLTICGCCTAAPTECDRHSRRLRRASHLLAQLISSVSTPVFLFTLVVLAIYQLEVFALAGYDILTLSLIVLGTGLALLMLLGVVATRISSFFLPALPLVLLLLCAYLLCVFTNRALFSPDDSWRMYFFSVACSWPMVWSFSWARAEAFHHFYRSRLQRFFFAHSDGTDDRADPCLRDCYHYADSLGFFFNTCLFTSSPLGPRNVTLCNLPEAHISQGVGQPDVIPSHHDEHLSWFSVIMTCWLRCTCECLLPDDEAGEDNQKSEEKWVRLAPDPLPKNPYGHVLLSTAMATSGAAFAFSNGDFKSLNTLSIRLLAQLLNVGMGSWIFRGDWATTCPRLFNTVRGRLFFSFLTILVAWHVPLIFLATDVNGHGRLAGLISYLCTFGLSVICLLLSARFEWWHPGSVFLLSPFWQSFTLLTGRESKLLSDPYVYLSDGGHFENLGILPLLAQRCPLLLVFDAGEDANFEMADLYKALQTAVRCGFIRPDYQFSWSPFQLMPWGEERPERRLLKVTAEYVDDGATVELWYVKSTLTGFESDGILHLHSSQASELAFPHHPTANQKMEANRRDAYIRLGRQSCEDLMAAIALPTPPTPAPAPTLTPTPTPTDRPLLVAMPRRHFRR